MTDLGIKLNRSNARAGRNKNSSDAGGGGGGGCHAGDVSRISLQLEMILACWLTLPERKKIILN